YPVAVLETLLDTGVQVADDHPALGDGFTLELEHEPEHTVRRRVLRSHVDDDALLGAGLVDDGVPVAAGDSEDLALGRFALARVAGAAHAIASLRSGMRSQTTELMIRSLRSLIGNSCAGRAAGSRRPCTRPARHRAGSPCAAGSPPSRPA